MRLDDAPAARSRPPQPVRLLAACSLLVDSGLYFSLGHWPSGVAFLISGLIFFGLWLSTALSRRADDA